MRAAEEAGLDPAEVRRAAAVLPPARGGLAAAVFGAPDRREVRAFLEDARLPEARHDLVRAAETALGRAGAVRDSDPVRFRWEESHLGGRTSLELEESGGGVAVRATADGAGHYLGAWFVALAGWATVSALANLGAVLAPLVVVLAFLFAPILAVRPFWTRADRRTRRRLDRLVMDALRVVDAAPPDALPPGGGDDGEAPG
jgi:Flp pilus assembly protein TadB